MTDFLCFLNICLDFFNKYKEDLDIFVISMMSLSLNPFLIIFKAQAFLTGKVSFPLINK